MSRSHDEDQSHPGRVDEEMVFLCKTCDKSFRKNLKFFERADEFCPHCGEHYVIPAEA